MGNGASAGAAAPGPVPGASQRGGQGTTADRLMAQQGMGKQLHGSELTPRGSVGSSTDHAASKGKHVAIAVADPRTVAYKGGTKVGLAEKLKQMAGGASTSAHSSPSHSPNPSRVASRAASQAPSRAASDKSIGTRLTMGQRLANNRRDEYDVDSDDDDLEGFIYEDESTSEDEREDYVNAFSRKKKLPKANDYSDYEGAAVRALTAGAKAPKSAAMRRAVRKSDSSRSSEDDDEDGDDEWDPEEDKIRLLRQQKKQAERAKAVAMAAMAAAAMSKSSTGGKKLDDGAGPSAPGGGRGGMAPKPPAEPPVRGSSGNIRRGQAAGMGGSGGGAPPANGLRAQAPAPAPVNYGASAASQYWQDKREKENDWAGDNANEGELSRLQQLLALKKKKTEREERQREAQTAGRERGGGGQVAGGGGGGGVRWGGVEKSATPRPVDDDEDTPRGEHDAQQRGLRWQEPGGAQRVHQQEASSTVKLQPPPPQQQQQPQQPQQQQPRPPPQPPPGQAREQQSPLRLNSEAHTVLLREQDPSSMPSGATRTSGAGNPPPMPQRHLNAGSNSGVDPYSGGSGAGHVPLMLPSQSQQLPQAQPPQQPSPPLQPRNAPHAPPQKKGTSGVTDFDVDDLLSTFAPEGARGPSSQPWAGSRPQPGPAEYVKGALHAPPEGKRSIRVMSDFVTVPRTGTLSAVPGEEDDEDVVDVASRMLSLPVAAPRPPAGAGGLGVHSAPSGSSLAGMPTAGPPASVVSRFSRMGGAGTPGPGAYSLDGGGSGGGNNVGLTPSQLHGSSYGASPGQSPVRPQRVGRQPSSDGSGLPFQTSLSAEAGINRRPGVSVLGSGTSPRTSTNGVGDVMLPVIRPSSPARLANGMRGSESGSGSGSILNSVASEPLYRGSLGGTAGSSPAAAASSSTMHCRSRFGAATHQQMQQEATRASMPSLPSDRDRVGGYDSDSALTRGGSRSSWNGSNGTGMRTSGAGGLPAGSTTGMGMGMSPVAGAPRTRFAAVNVVGA